MPSLIGWAHSSAYPIQSLLPIRTYNTNNATLPWQQDHSVVFMVQWSLSITTAWCDTSLPSGAYLGHHGPPRWAPEMQISSGNNSLTHYCMYNCDSRCHLIKEAGVINDRFHCESNHKISSRECPGKKKIKLKSHKRLKLDYNLVKQISTTGYANLTWAWQYHFAFLFDTKNAHFIFKER